MRLLAFFLLISATANAEDLQYLDRSELALARLYTGIANAQSSIDFTYFIWDPCSSVSKVLMKKIREKTHPPKGSGLKPVTVRLNLDSFFARDRIASVQDYFRQNGVDIRIYNGMFPVADDHTHSKFTLIDKDVPGKALLISGGRNVQDEYFGLHEGHNYVDRDVALTGSAAKEDPNGAIAQAKHGFDRLWANPKSEIVNEASDEQKARIAACTKWTPKDAALQRYLDANAARIVAGEAPVTCPKVTFTMDDMSHAQLPMSERIVAKPTSRAVLDFVSGARNRLTMENQYYIPDDRYLRPLLRSKKAADKPIRVEVFSNMFDRDSGIESVFDMANMEMVSHWQNVAMREDNGGGQTNHMNFRIAGLLDHWAMSPANTNYTYHAKTFAADGKDAIVSSFNLDTRSMLRNGESAVVAKNCPAFAKKVEDVAKLTGKVWTLEENLFVCVTGHRPQPPGHDPVTGLLEFFTKDLQ